MNYNEAPTNLLKLRLNRLVTDSKIAADRLIEESSDPVLCSVLRTYKNQPITTDVGDPLKQFIRYHNLATLIWDCFSDETIPSGAMAELDSIYAQIRHVTEILIDRMQPEGLQLRWFTCAECGHEMQLYTYSDIEDTRLSTGNEKDKDNNARCVYEFMHKSHLCEYCWSKFIVRGE